MADAVLQDAREKIKPDNTRADAGLQWRQAWYPLVFTADLPDDKPYGVALYDHRLVLYRDNNGKVQCLRDRCAHRAARLSDGQLCDGNIECLYHGWQFSENGQCVHIPQMAAGEAIPAKANIPAYPVVEEQGLIWVWPDLTTPPDPAALPTLAALDKPDVQSLDYMTDLPYGQSYLIENVIDIAHIHVAHHGMRGGGHRSLAQPLEFSIDSSTVSGIKGTFRTVGFEQTGVENELQAATVEFVAPNLILYESNYRDPDLASGLALYAIPVGDTKCRLLYRSYSNFYGWKERYRPRWVHHWNLNKILEQDMQVVIGQHEEIEESGLQLKQLWMPIKSSDALVVAYRQWIDKFGRNWPGYRGYVSADSDGSVEAQRSPGRFVLHTQVCQSCSRVYQRVLQAKNWGKVLILLLLVLSAVASGSGWMYAFVALASVLLLAVIGLAQIQRRFETDHQVYENERLGPQL